MSDPKTTDTTEPGWRNDPLENTPIVRGYVPFRFRAFDWAHAAVRHEQAYFRDMLKTWRRPAQKGSDDV